MVREEDIEAVLAVLRDAWVTKPEQSLCALVQRAAAIGVDFEQWGSYERVMAERCAVSEATDHDMIVGLTLIAQLGKGDAPAHLAFLSDPRYAPVAQGTEQVGPNDKVAGSIPAGRTNDGREPPQPIRPSPLVPERRSGPPRGWLNWPFRKGK